MQGDEDGGEGKRKVERKHRIYGASASGDGRSRRSERTAG